MNAEHTQESQQYPGQVVIDRAGDKAVVGLPVHCRDQEQVNNPADKEQAQGAEPDDTGYLFAIVESVCTHKAENPQEVTD